jgi:NADH dehydrogenase
MAAKGRGDPMSGSPHVVIVGGGFGGLTAAQALARAKVRITLLDRSNHHTFQPLLYQVAMAGLSPAEIAQPIRAIVSSQANVTVLMAEAARVDLARREIHTSDGAVVPWDYLVLACGAETSHFGHDAWRERAPGLKSIEDALDIRTRVLLAFELAEREEDEARREELLGFSVIGGGPTGVELAGALAELAKFVLDRDFRRIDPTQAKVRLLEAGPRILPTFPEDLAASAVRQLHELGVEVRTGARVTSIEPGAVHLGTERVPSSVVLWAAGVRAQPLAASLGVSLDKLGRVIVGRDLAIPGHPNAFAIGDAARFDGPDGQALPGVSPVAMQQARAVAKTIRAEATGKQRPSEGRQAFSYFDKGSMATIGRSRAIAMTQRMRMSGFLAWLAWLFIHIFYLIGFKNRFVVLFTWLWSYVTYRRGARLVTTPVRAPGWRVSLAGPSPTASLTGPSPLAGSPPPASCAVRMASPDEAGDPSIGAKASPGETAAESENSPKQGESSLQR